MSNLAYLLVIVPLVVLVGVAVFVVTRRTGEGTPLGGRGSDRPGVASPGEQRGDPGVATLPDTVADATDEPVPSDHVGVVDDPPGTLDGVDVVEAPPEMPERATFSNRLARARTALSGALGSIRGHATVDAETWDDLEEALIRADVGVGPTAALLDAVRARARKDAITTPEGLIEAVKSEMVDRLLVPIDLRVSAEAPTIWLFVGVNGVGKTTTIGKVGKRLRDDGHTVLMAAGDTFRAAAAEQLATWSERCGADLVRGAEGADPSAVIFDGVAKAAAAGTEYVLADTAGRLHTKSNLMDELRKVRRVADKGAGEVTESLLVLDATTGQNGLAQARQFTEAIDLTGVVLTKLDGSAKGGIVFAIQSELGIPVKLVGLGEQAEDLVEFDPEQFVEALFEPVPGSV
ncbi:MAG: signal recognition particle-docking protein FtsY [Microthrixaceae bacterium]